jgi:hypothetical protein
MTMRGVARLVLHVDAVVNVGLAAGVLALLGPLAAAAGLGSVWPLIVLAALLLANGALCWRAARADGPAPRALRGLAEIDVVFTVAVAWLALADPTGAATWLRVLLGGLAAAVGAVAAVKLVLAARLVPAEPVGPPRRLTG